MGTVRVNSKRYASRRPTSIFFLTTHEAQIGNANALGPSASWERGHLARVEVGRPLAPSRAGSPRSREGGDPNLSFVRNQDFLSGVLRVPVRSGPFRSGNYRVVPISDRYDYSEIGSEMVHSSSWKTRTHGRCVDSPARGRSPACPGRNRSSPAARHAAFRAPRSNATKGGSSTGTPTGRSPGSRSPRARTTNSRGRPCRRSWTGSPPCAARPSSATDRWISGCATSAAGRGASCRRTSPCTCTRRGRCCRVSPPWCSATMTSPTWCWR